LINYDGKCLDMTGGSRANGIRVQQWTCNGRLRQYWAAITVNTPAGIQAVEFKNLNSGKCLTIRNNSSAHGAAVVQQPCRGGANFWQDWYSEDSGNATYPTVWFVAGDAQPTPPVCCAIHPSGNHIGNGIKMYVNVPNNVHYWWRWGAAH
jgi:hypothetical protein